MPNVYGRLPHTPDPRDYRARITALYAGAFVDLTDGFPPIWDQGQLGSCVSFGAAAAAMYARTKMGLPPMDPSQLFVYYAARVRAGYPVTEDTGLEIRDGFAALAKDGVPPSIDWPYVIGRFADKPPTAAYSDAALDEATVYGAVAAADVDAVIAGGYPVTIGFDVFESFESDTVARTGIMTVPGPGERKVGGHCVVLVSTPKAGVDIPGGVAGLTYRKARNSWSSGWGAAGYFWYPLGAMKYASDFWQVTTVNAPTPPVPPDPGPEPNDADAAFLVACEAFREVLEPFTRSRGWCGSRVRRAGKTWLDAETAWRNSSGGTP